VPPWACLPGWLWGLPMMRLPRIWPYLGKYYEWNMGKYSARPITLSHGGILTNGFLRLKRETLEMRITVSREQIAQRARAIAYWYILTGSFSLHL
jgi:hypothetical protein